MARIGDLMEDLVGNPVVVLGVRPGFLTVLYEGPAGLKGHRVTSDADQFSPRSAPVTIPMMEAERVFWDTEVQTVIPQAAEVPMAPIDTNGASFVSELAFVNAEAGADLRDFGGAVGNGYAPVGEPQIVGPVVVGGLAAARGLLLRIMAGASTVLAVHWARLPGWAQVALQAAGITIGTELAVEALGGEGFIPGLGLPDGVAGTPHLDIPGAHLGAHVIGSWNTNPKHPDDGVTFYRLSDGKLAVQNKKGRWKVWRPKKPIVLMPTGAGDLRTLLRADVVLNRQAKKIANMLNRRAPKRARKEPKRLVMAPTDGTRIINVD